MIHIFKSLPTVIRWVSRVSKCGQSEYGGQIATANCPLFVP